MSHGKIISYDYLKFLDKDPQTKEITGESYAAVVSIRISSVYKFSVPFHALVDSGASVNLFPAHFGEQVGINIKSGKKTKLSFSENNF